MVADQRDSEKLLSELHRIVNRPIRIMVACGTQNRAILQYGLRDKLPDLIQLVAGPGCSVCVTPVGHVDAFMHVARQAGVITTTCLDLLRLPGSFGSLEDIKKAGGCVELISSPREALTLALEQPDKIIFYPAVGFEATAPSIAETILEAARLGVDNFCVLPSIRLLPPTLDALLLDSGLNIQGMLCSDHLNTISDTEAYTKIAKKHNLSCCIAGFEQREILQGLLGLVQQILCGESLVDDSGAVIYSNEENNKARKMVSEVFFATETRWRGLGDIKDSGFVIREELALYDATKRFNVRFFEGHEQYAACRCSDIISGRSLPPDCPAFGMACTLKNPVGPCMISEEGICASYFKYNLAEPVCNELEA